MVNVQEGYINSKKAALVALGALAENTKEDFYPFLQTTYEALTVPVRLFYLPLVYV